MTARHRTVLVMAAGLLHVSTACAVDTSKATQELQFSPNGQYVLAQDDAEISVLSVQPLAVLFRIPADDATDARFAADSLDVVVARSVTHASEEKVTVAKSETCVERWSVLSRVRVRSLIIPTLACGTERLSPGGGVLACVDFAGTLQLVDTTTGGTLLVKKRFAQPLVMFPPSPSRVPGGTTLINNNVGSADIGFSTDAQFLVAFPHAYGRSICWDLRNMKYLALNGGLREIRQGVPNNVHFAFISPDRLILASHGTFFAKGGLVSDKLVAVPSGRVLSELRLPAGVLYRAADPGFVIIRPFLEPGEAVQRAVAVELATGEGIISETAALDVLGRYYVAESSPGVVGLYQRGKGLQATVTLHKK